MDDKNSSNVRHPLHAALMIFHATLRTAFETAAAFWRPWFREPEKKEVAAREQSKATSKEALQTERIQKTERLRKLQLTKEAADPEKKPSGNGCDEAQHAIKKRF
jgi:hypothetical protein